MNTEQTTTEKEKLDRVSGLLSMNLTIFHQMANGCYGAHDGEAHKNAVQQYVTNLKLANNILGITQLRVKEKIEEHRKSLKEIEDNKEYVVEFIDTIKADLDDIEYPKFNRVYKLNLESEGKFDVINEPVESPESAIWKEPIGQEIYSVDTWLEAVGSDPIRPHFELGLRDHTLILDEDIISASKNFLLGPVGAWRNKVLVAETRQFNSLEELKQNILKEAGEKDMVLYKVYTFEQIDWSGATSFDDIDSRPKITQYAWRGCFLDKEQEKAGVPLTEAEAAVFDSLLNK